MSPAQATQAPETGRIDLHGELDADRVPDLLPSIKDWLSNARDTLHIELGQIERADSAGAAFLLEVQRRAQSAGKTVEFSNPTDQMRAIIDFCALDQVLALA